MAPGRKSDAGSVGLILEAPMPDWTIARRAALLAMALTLGACAARPGAPVWGEGATLTPGWGRIGAAARTAALDPFTWAPAAGALALQVGDLDTEIADWANDETPVFGTRGAASDASDWLRAASLGVYLGTGLMAPAGAQGLESKIKGLTVGVGAIAATAAVSEAVKRAAGRERPLGQDDASLPSRHTALAAVGARLSHQTLRHYDLPPAARISADIGLAGLTLATGWARVEAGEHHPADVLAGAALGNFIAVFATEAFLRPALNGELSLHVGPYRDGWVLGAAVAFCEPPGQSPTGAATTHQSG
jgi:membrane-associated phospholipid phosphatase